MPVFIVANTSFFFVVVRLAFVDWGVVFIISSLRHSERELNYERTKNKEKGAARLNGYSARALEHY